MFFAPSNPETALGMYSKGYFITLLVVMMIVITGIVLSRHFSHNVVKWIVFGTGVFLWITEFIKMVFIKRTYGIDKVEWIPLYFCSMEMYACVLILFKNNFIHNMACSFIFFGGIIGAITFFFHPSACIPNYPLLHFMTLRTFIYHGLMIYNGFLIVLTGYYEPIKKHFKEFSIFMGLTFLGAYIINTIKGINLMYISKPIDVAISEYFFNLLGPFYPFVFALVQLLGSFFVTYYIYKLIITILEKKKEKKICLQ